MSNFLPPETVTRMEELFSSGFGIRATARMVGCSKNTASKYFPRFGQEPLCPCGAPVRHQGWCNWRYQNSPARQLFMKRWHSGDVPAIIKVKLPSFEAKAFQAKGNDLLLLVNGLVPRGLPEQLRGDVCQEIILAVLSGELKQVDIPKELQRFIRGQRKALESHYMAISLDTPMRDGRSWHDVLAAPVSD